MARVVVDVMLKPEILDPQGKAVQGALPRLGFDGVVDVRQGKRFELEIAEPLTEARIAEVHRIAETLLSNPVIEDFVVSTGSTTRDGSTTGDSSTARDSSTTGESSTDGADL